MTEFCAKFLSCERREALFRREIDGVRHWHLIRYRVFNDLVLPHFIEHGPLHPDDELQAAKAKGIVQKVLHRMNRMRGRIADATIHNPDVAFAKYPILFAMTPREAAMADGRIGFPMLDFVVEKLETPYAVFEHPRLLGYTCQPGGRKVFHWPFLRHVRDERLAETGEFAKAAPRRKAEAESLAAILQAEYGFPFEAGRIWWMIDDLLRFREIYGDSIRRWLTRLGVKVLVTSVAEYRENILFIEAAHELGVPVVELQHGTVYPEHMVYSLGERDAVHSPDYFFTWGKHWNRQLTNYPARAAISCGYPFLDYFAEHNRPCPRKGPLGVLFLSQGPIGRELSRLAIETFRAWPRSQVEIVYKLHPNETRSWRGLYPDLESSGVKVVGNDERNIYQCLQDADVTVGTNSSAMIEGFAWGVKALVMRNLPAGFTMEPFCRSGAAEFIEDGGHLIRRIGELSVEKGGEKVFGLETEDYFLPGAAVRIAGYLEDLAAGREIAI